MTNLPSPRPDELSKKIAEVIGWVGFDEKRYSRADAINRIMSYIAHHTQEAVEAATQEYQTEYEQRHIASAIRVARKDELERLYRVAHRGNFYDAEIHYRIAELSAPQQSTGGGDE